MLAMIFGGIAVICVCLWLKTRIWLLIPLCWGLTGKISLLPLPFSVRDLSVLLVTGMFGVLFALKMVRLKSQTGWLEVLVAINVTYVASMFIRHPVGTSAFGSVMVGGRPYFDILIALITFLVLRSVTISPRQARIFPFFLLAGSLMVTVLNLIVRLFPPLVAIIAPLYSGINVQGYMEAEGYKSAADPTVKRYGELVGPGSTILQILCSYFRPLSLLVPTHPFRTILFFLGGLGMLYSGFRSSIIASGFFFLFAAYFQGGTRDLFNSIFVGISGLVLLLVFQLFVGLPLQAQRALSFIPLIPWNEQAKADADDSSQWRIDMWKMVLNEKKYINDKVWGDGFGFTAYELNIMVEADFGGTGFIGGAVQEAFMINGTFHSGPLSTIRYAGVVGLILFLAWNFHLSFQAPKLIRLARGTPYFPATLFLIMPMIYLPLFFIFIFGGYESAFPDLLFTSGLFSMLKNSLIQYRENLKIA